MHKLHNKTKTGPFPITKVLSPTNYVIDTDHTDHVVHISRLAPYFSDRDFPARMYDRFIERTTDHAAAAVASSASDVRAVACGDDEAGAVTDAQWQAGVDQPNGRPYLRPRLSHPASNSTTVDIPPSSPQAKASEDGHGESPDEQFDVGAILDREVRRSRSRTRPKQVYYKVRWLGYGSEHDTWEPEHELQRNCKHLLNKYNTSHPIR